MEPKYQYFYINSTQLHKTVKIWEVGEPKMPFSPSSFSRSGLDNIGITLNSALYVVRTNPF